MFKHFPEGQDRKRNIKYFSRNLIAITAKNDRAVRLSRFFRSSLLSAQYLINTLDGHTSDDLKNIYYFMAGINIITASYSYFTRSDFELYYENSKKTAMVAPFALPDGGGLAFAWKF
jgi:hypothetical protein